MLPLGLILWLILNKRRDDRRNNFFYQYYGWFVPLKYGSGIQMEILFNNIIKFVLMKNQEEPRVVSGLNPNYNQSDNNLNQHPSSPTWNATSPDAIDFDEELQNKRQQYLQDLNERRRQFEKVKRERFGASSSEEDDVGGSQSDSDTQRRKSTMEEQSRYKESQFVKEVKVVEKVEKCQVYFSVKKVKQNWSLESLDFHEQSLIVSEKHYYLKQFHKIKIIQGMAIADCHRIKLSTIDESQLFIAANCKNYKEFPLNYYIFAFVIQQKLTNMGKKLYKCSLPNVPGIPETLVKNSYNYGKIFKKSQILGKWQERLIVINRQGIFSYKKFNEKHSMFIAGNSVKQLWTRFQIEDGLLVIKILHSNSTKTEFGIPLTEVLDRRSWLFSFYLLVFPQ